MQYGRKQFYMQKITEQRFKGRAMRTVFLYSTLLQTACAVLRYIYDYSIMGNESFGIWDTVIGETVSFLGNISVFTGYAAVLYLVFLFGLRGGGEWTIAIAVGYAFLSYLISYMGSITFALVTTTLMLIIFASVYNIWQKGCDSVHLLLSVTLIIPYLCAMLLLFATTNVSTESLSENVFYGLMNLTRDFLMLILISRLANLFRSRAIMKGKGSADISLGGKLFSKKNYILKTVFAVDILFLIVALISPIYTSIDAVIEYGWPVNADEWLSLFRPYIELSVIFVVGYLVMVWVASRLENDFLSSTVSTKK